jgi:hypothetical protein
MGLGSMPRGSPDSAGGTVNPAQDLSSSSCGAEESGEVLLGDQPAGHDEDSGDGRASVFPSVVTDNVAAGAEFIYNLLPNNTD